MAVKSRRVEYSDATRAALLASARRRFTDAGYEATAVDEICADARLTKGALYHHFRNKRALFEAVFEDVERAVMERVAAAAAAASDPWQGALAGMRAFLDACMDPGFQRLALREAPAVLGIDRWREIDERYAMGLVMTTLEGLMAAGVMERRPVGLVARVVLGAINEAALAIGASEDPAAMRAEADRLLTGLLRSLLARPE